MRSFNGGPSLPSTKSKSSPMATLGEDNSATLLHPSERITNRTRSSEYRPTSRNKRTAYMTQWELGSTSTNSYTEHYVDQGNKENVHPNKKSSVETQVINDSDLTQSIPSERADYQQCEDEGYLDVGDAMFSCKYCYAILWYEERVDKVSTPVNPEFSLCCMKGKTALPFLNNCPQLLSNLVNGHDSRSQSFIDNIRQYNSMFAFTSLGGKIDTRINDGRGPPQFVISGQNYHRMGSLVPHDGQVPKFAQLYVYDTQHEVSNRLSAFRSNGSSDGVDSGLVQELIQLLDTHNVLAKSFRMVRDYVDEVEHINLTIRLFRDRQRDPRVYNLPTVEEVAALIVGDFDSSECGRDIVVRSNGGEFRRIHETHTCYLPLQYPLLFPYGEDGYSENIKFSGSDDDLAIWKRTRVSLREYLSFRLQERTQERTILLRSCRLFQQFVVDCYSMVESQRLSFIRNNQVKIRQDFLSGVQEAIDRGDVDPASIGSRVVLPSSFVGGRRYMFNNCQDAMAICKQFGYPDLFITLTCNPKWPELQRFLQTRTLKAQDRPDIVCRVFRIKLDQLMTDFKKGHFFGKVVAGMYSIEFQKRGLPHAHILLWMDTKSKLTSAEKIDSVISAELPDPVKYPALFNVVSSYMVHGPCGTARKESPCMQRGKCTKYFPKGYVDKTSFDTDGYPIYRRRNTGVTTLRSGIPLDNRFVVPYNPRLLMRYQAQINIECCNKSNSIKYLFKYISKGVDIVTISLGNDQQRNEQLQTVDEIKHYYDCRYLSPCESMWRIFAFDVHHRWPPVQEVTFHLPQDQVIVFKDTDPIDRVLYTNINKNTMFLAWMEANTRYPDARNLTYAEFPNFFIFDAKKTEWRPRQRGFSIGRMNFIPPGVGELYYLRLLLNVQRGCTSYEELRTVNGHTYHDFREACGALGLLEDNKEFIDGIIEASKTASSLYLRKLFVSLMMSNTMSNLSTVWEQT